MGVQQAERQPAYQTLADDLRTQITSGRLRPGDRLPTEPQLCARSGVSRSTVREALRLLASQHLIVTTRGVTGGSFVAQPSPAQLADTLSASIRLLASTGRVGTAQLLEVRETFEVPIAGLAAQRRTEESLAAVRATMPDPDTAGPDALLAAHRAFHVALAVAAGNPLYELFTRPLYGAINERALGVANVPGFWRRVDSEHRRLVEAVAAGDPRAARTAARDHLDHLRGVYTSRSYRQQPG